MPLLTEADGERLIAQLLAIKAVMRRHAGERFDEFEISGHPQEVRVLDGPAFVFDYGDVAFCRHTNGVSEARIAGRFVFYARYDEDGSCLRRTCVDRAGTVTLESVLERAGAASEGDLN